MSNIRFNASRKTTVILLFVLFLIVGGTGGYLLWRVNQEQKLSPGSSQAGELYCCCPGSIGNQGCLNPQFSWMEPCYCDVGNWCATIPECGENQVECTTGEDCNGKTHCYWPQVSFCNMGTCECKSGDNNCSDDGPQCTPECPPGYTKCSGASCVGEVIEVECQHLCASCNNEYNVKAQCNKIPPNTCDAVGAAANITLNTTTPAYCGPVNFSYVAGDTDGVGTVTVKLDNVAITATEVVEGKTKRITGTIPADKNCNTTAHTLTISWVDVGGNAGNSCTKSINYTPQANKCDGGGWSSGGNPGATATASTGRVYKYCEDITYSAYGQDVHGIKRITSKLGSAVRQNLTPGTYPPTLTVSEKLSNNATKQCLAPGTYTLNIDWIDRYEVGGSGACALTTSFTVSQEVQPEWSIEKTPAEVCIDENTENPKAELSYNIVITNTGSVPGTITRVEDTLDSKVVGTSVTNILPTGGVYQNGKIVWDFSTTPLSFAAKESKTFSYKYIVEKEAFGEYNNTVVATVGATLTKPATTIQDSTNITADCEIAPYVPPTTPPTQPQTGLFDDSKNIVMIGAVLLFMGLGWSWITESFSTMKNRLSEGNKSRFEKRVSRR